MKKWIKKNQFLLIFIGITFLTLLIRIPMIKFASLDYTQFLKNWFLFMKQNGGIKAIGSFPGDYNIPYIIVLGILTYIPINSLISIKLVSIVFDYILALSSCLLAHELLKRKGPLLNLQTLMVYGIVLLIPPVLTNSAMWGQCDSIYTSFMILSLLFLLRKKYHASFILLGIAFSWKLQFIFILPLYVVLYFSKKEYSIFHFLYLPLVNIIMSIPAVLTGKNLLEIFKIYYNQTQEFKGSYVLNFPNVYNFIEANPATAYLVGEIITLLACFIILLWILIKKIKWNHERILLLGTYFIFLTTYLLPGMHERYAYAGEVLLTIYCLIYKKNISFLIIALFTGIFTYSWFYTLKTIIPIVYLSILYSIGMIIFTMNIYKEFSKENQKIKN